MRKRVAISLGLLILLSTITLKQEIIISKFNLKEINVKNNILLKDEDIQSLLISFYGKNLIFLRNNEVKNKLMMNSFIDSLHIRKKYPNTLELKIYEKKPIAILQDKRNKFYLSEKVDLIEYKKIESFKNLPHVFGKLENFKIFYNDLKKTNFPVKKIKKFIFFGSNRWDIETNDGKILRLPSRDYINSLENYTDLIKKIDVKKYKIFDYRISGQLILK